MSSPCMRRGQGSPNGHTLARLAWARVVVIAKQTEAEAGVLLWVAGIPIDFAIVNSWLVTSASRQSR
jgi:hypothetical protein